MVEIQYPLRKEINSLTTEHFLPCGKNLYLIISRFLKKTE